MGNGCRTKGQSKWLQSFKLWGRTHSSLSRSPMAAGVFYILTDAPSSSLLYPRFWPPHDGRSPLHDGRRTFLLSLKSPLLTNT